MFLDGDLAKETVIATDFMPPQK